MLSIVKFGLYMYNNNLRGGEYFVDDYRIISHLYMVIYQFQHPFPHSQNPSARVFNIQTHFLSKFAQKFRHFLLAFNGFSQVYLSAAQMLNAIIAKYSQITHGKHPFPHSQNPSARVFNIQTHFLSKFAQKFRHFMLGNRIKPIKYRLSLQKFRRFLLAFNGFSQIYLSAAQMLNAIIAKYSQITHGKHPFPPSQNPSAHVFNIQTHFLSKLA